MEIYNNDYTQNEDITLWELHEIRHELHKEFKRKSIAQINAEARHKYLNWQKQRRERTGHVESAVLTT